MTSLYNEHFGLNEAPFSITPNPHFFFAGSGRGSMLEALRYAFASEEGIVTVIGEVGSGKTMLCRMLLDELPDDIDAIYLGNPSFSRNEILDAIAHDLGVSAGSAPTRIDALNAELIRRYADGRRVVLLIDEAHAMPRDSLEEVRLLSNLETSEHKLLNIILFGQPELNQLLAQNDLRQLRERVVQRFELGPLPKSEIADYLAFRLRAAGHRDSFPFAPPAVALIARCSEGITRRINILADKALLSAFARNTRKVEREDVERAARDAGLVAPRKREWKPLAQAAAVLLAIGAAFGLGRMGGADSEASRPGAPNAAVPSAVQEQSTEPAPAPAPAVVVDTSRNELIAEAAQPAASPATVTAPAASADFLADGHLLASAERDLRHWIGHDNAGYTLQIATMRTQNEAQAEDELRRLVQSVPDQAVRVLRRPQSNGQLFIFFLGDFASNADAQQAIARLPDNLRTNQPIVRSHSAVRAGASPTS
ncbi:AAA family ATPase [Pseudomarimonas arenosa]|uniref:AAA family ATPase n=1 Tax=Pseudomarimonas arenosa TaxID=2774145 RepID=A0AAW3ZNZ9_9GAMM|nr:AAA family ATPase [Pseudomarimonas arenosa]MBD8525996.1 AAA family ATPase [Pseudomarimonas arenosa]